MLVLLLIVASLIAVTVAVHAAGFDALLRTMVRSHALNLTGFTRITGLLIGMMCWLVMVHVVEIAIWGFFYLWLGCMSDGATAFYFSSVTYTSIGDATLALPAAWRLLAPLEAMLGILMFGVSASLFFAVISRWISNWIHKEHEAEVRSAGR